MEVHCYLPDTPSEEKKYPSYRGPYSCQLAVASCYCIAEESTSHSYQGHKRSSKCLDPRDTLSRKLSHHLPSGEHYPPEPLLLLRAHTEDNSVANKSYLT